MHKYLQTPLENSSPIPRYFLEPSYETRVSYWHTFRNPLSDPFGVGTAIRPWDDGSPSIENACNRGVSFNWQSRDAARREFHPTINVPEKRLKAAVG
jgi:xylose isomerase